MGKNKLEMQYSSVVSAWFIGRIAYLLKLPSYPSSSPSVKWDNCILLIGLFRGLNQVM